VSLELHKSFILTYIKVVNIPLFTVCHDTASSGNNLRFPVSGCHIDLCRLQSVRKDKSGHTGYQTATYHA